MKKVYFVGMLILAFAVVKAQSIWMNPVTGTNPSADNPFTLGQVTDGNLHVSGIGRGPGISASAANNRYNASGWSTTVLAEEDYFYFILSPANGFTLNLASFEYTGQASGTGPVSFSLRSSLDGYANEISSPTAAGGVIDLSGPGFQSLADTISFRLYAWGAASGGGTFSINDFVFQGTLTAGAVPSINLAPGSLEGFLAGLSIPSPESQYLLSASNLSGEVILAPSPGFELTLTPGTAYVAYPSSLALSPSGGNIAPTAVFVRLNPSTYGPLQGSVLHSSPGAASQVLELSGNVIAESPAIQGEVSVVSVSNSTVELSFTPGNGSKRILLAKQDTPVDALPLDGNTYTSSTSFGSGNELGNGNFAVYAGTGNSAIVSGLSPGTSYHFAIFEYNDENVPGAENYLDALTGTTSTVTSSGVTTYSWAVGDGDWSVASNWMPARLNPLPSDILQFTGGTIITVSVIGPDSFGQLIIGDSTELNLVAGTGATFLVNGLDGIDLLVESGSSLRLQDNAPITISLGGGATGLINGSLHFAGEPHRLQAPDASAVLFGAGGGLYLGTGFSGNVFGNSAQGAFQFTQGSVLQQSAGASPFGSTNALTFQPGSLFRYTGSTAPSFNGRNYADVEIDLPGTNPITIIGSNAASIDNFSITAGTVNFNMTGSGHTIHGNVFVAAGASLNFLPNNPSSIRLAGSDSQTFINMGSLSANSNVQFELDNPAGLEIGGDITMAGATLVLTNGMVTIGNHNLELAAVSGAGPTRYIRTNGSGMLTFTAIGADEKLFPVGNSHFNPVTIASGNSLGWSVRVEDGLVVNDPAFAGNVDRAVQRNWQITHSPGSTQPGARITFQYNDLSDVGSSFNPLADARLWRRVGDNWIPAGSTQAPLGTPGGDRTVALENWNDFSPFAIANVDAPLPVRFFNVKAVPHLAGVKVNWQNLAEMEVLQYFVERAANGHDFETIGEVPPRSNNGGMESYEFFDPQPCQGYNFYRIRSEERVGLAEYSDIQMVYRGLGSEDLLLYPNPVKAGRMLYLRLPELPTGKIGINIVDILGRQVASQEIDCPGPPSTCSIVLHEALRGRYWVQVWVNGKRYTGTVMVD